MDKELRKQKMKELQELFDQEVDGPIEFQQGTYHGINYCCMKILNSFDEVKKIMEIENK